MSRMSSKLNYKNPFCYILVGPAGCGKSSVAAQLLQHPTMEDAAVVSTEALVNETARVRGKTYAEVFEWFNQSEFKRYVRETISSAVASNKNILVDRCNLTVKARSVITRQLPSYYNVVIVVMRYDEQKVIDNLRENEQLREKKIPLANVLNMFSIYEEPSSEECDLIISQEAIYA